MSNRMAKLVLLAGFFGMVHLGAMDLARDVKQMQAYLSFDIFLKEGQLDQAYYFLQSKLDSLSSKQQRYWVSCLINAHLDFFHYTQATGIIVWAVSCDIFDQNDEVQIYDQILTKLMQAGAPEFDELTRLALQNAKRKLEELAICKF